MRVLKFPLDGRSVTAQSEYVICSEWYRSTTIFYSRRLANKQFCRFFSHNSVEFSGFQNANLFLSSLFSRRKIAFWHDVIAKHFLFEIGDDWHYSEVLHPFLGVQVLLQSSDHLANVYLYEMLYISTFFVVQCYFALLVFLSCSLSLYFMWSFFFFLVVHVVRNYYLYLWSLRYCQICLFLIFRDRKQ